MKAIITQSTEFPKLNGLTFELASIDTRTVTFLIDNHYVKLPFSEVFLVDLKEEHDKLIKSIRSGNESSWFDIESLNYYIKEKKINILPF